jgi:branched-chain amino acid transport system ATP-binding protein
MLEIKNLSVSYGHVQAVREADLTVREGEITAIIGSNGAGKTSTLLAISGLAPISSGSIALRGREIARTPPHRISALGVAHVLEGRQLFADQSVEDNLLLGAYSLRRDKATIRARIEREMNRFPILRERRTQLAGTLSGGEQQMLAISRALMSDPKLLLMDEPSMGLAPLVVQTIARTIHRLKDEGVTILLVEQLATVALHLAGHAYVLENGKVTLSGTGAEVAQNPDVKRAYLGG